MDYQDYYQTLGVPREPRARPRSRRPSASSPGSTIPTRSRATRPPSSASSRSTRPTPSCPTRRSARSTTPSARTGRPTARPASPVPPAARSRPAVRSAASAAARTRPAAGNVRYEFRTSGGGGGDFSDFFRIFFGDEEPVASGPTGEARTRPTRRPAFEDILGQMGLDAAGGVQGGRRADHGTAARPARRVPSAGRDGRGDRRDRPRGGLPRHDPPGRDRRRSASTSRSRAAPTTARRSS